MHHNNDMTIQYHYNNYDYYDYIVMRNQGGAKCLGYYVGLQINIGDKKKDSVWTTPERDLMAI